MLSKLSSTLGNISDHPYIGIGTLVTLGCTTAYALHNKHKLTSNLTKYSSEETKSIEKIKSTYRYFLGGLSITAVGSYVLSKTKLLDFLISTNASSYIGFSALATLPFLIGMYISNYKKQSLFKHINWIGFNIGVGAILTPLSIIGGPILARAALATACVMGGISVAVLQMNEKNLQSDLYHKIRITMGIIGGTVFSYLLGYLLHFPGCSLSKLNNVLVYSGIVFACGNTAMDIQKLINNSQCRYEYDPICESMDTYWNIITIFIKILNILAKNEKMEKKDKKD